MPTSPSKKQLIQKIQELERLVEGFHSAEARLREKEATMQGLLHAAPLGIGMVNNFSERTIVWTNEHFAGMLGYKPDELNGRSARELYVDQSEFERVGRVKHPDMQAKGVGSLEARMGMVAPWERRQRGEATGWGYRVAGSSVDQRSDSCSRA